MHDSADRFSSALDELHTISKVNNAGVDACLANYNRYKDAQSAEMLASSFAYGLRQIAYLRNEMLCLAVGVEIEAAASSPIEF